MPAETCNFKSHDRILFSRNSFHTRFSFPYLSFRKCDFDKATSLYRLTISVSPETYLSVNPLYTPPPPGIPQSPPPSLPPPSSISIFHFSCIYYQNHFKHPVCKGSEIFKTRISGHCYIHTWYPNICGYIFIGW